MLSNGRVIRGIWRHLRPPLCRKPAHFSTAHPVRNDDRNRADGKQQDLSHFFDRQTFPASYEAANKPLHEIVSPSKRAVAAFRIDLASRDDERIIAGYAALLQAWERHKTSYNASSSRPFKLDHSFPLRKNDIQKAIRFLIENARAKHVMDHKSLSTIQQMFEDMVATFGLKHGPTDLHYQVQACCLQSSRQGIVRDPMQAFRDLRAANPDWRTSSIEWTMVAQFLSWTDQHDRAGELWEEMKQHGAVPETRFHTVMIRLLFQCNNVEEAESYLLSIEQQDGQLDIKVLTAAVENYCDLFQTDQLQQSLVELRLRKYAQLLRSELSNEPSADPAASHAFLRYESLLLGPAHALQTAKQLGSGLDPQSITQLLRLQTDELRSLQTSDDALALLDKILDLNPSNKAKPSDDTYQLLVLALLGKDAKATADAVPTPNQIREAQMLYDQLQSSGLRLGPRVTAPLITAYCEAFLPSLSAAMRLIKDLLQDSQRASDGTITAFDMNIVGPFIQACTKLRDLSMANDLITRLRKAGVPMEARDKQDVARQLMSIATTWREAFAVYQNVGRLPLKDHSRQGYDKSGYAILLDVFRKLSCRDDEFSGVDSNAESVAPPEHILCILEDMRRAGYQPSCVVYTTILDYYSKLSTPSYEGVQATHNLLKSDETLEPDLPLINALMNAYNRANEPAVVLAIWDSLMATRQEIDGVTLSVFFDTCGRTGWLERARMALTASRRMDANRRELPSRPYRPSAMNKGAWDSYLECLARCGRLEEAIELVFGEMRRSLLRDAINAKIIADVDETASLNDLLYRQTQKPIRTRTGQLVGPDVKSFETLLKFAAKERDASRPLPLKSFFPTSRFSISADDRTDSGHSIWHTLRQRIKEDYSWIYPSVRDIGHGPAP